MEERMFCKFCKRKLFGEEREIGWHSECKKIMNGSSSYFYGLTKQENEILSKMIDLVDPKDILIHEFSKKLIISLNNWDIDKDIFSEVNLEYYNSELKKIEIFDQLESLIFGIIDTLKDSKIEDFSIFDSEIETLTINISELINLKKLSLIQQSENDFVLDTYHYNNLKHLECLILLIQTRTVVINNIYNLLVKELVTNAIIPQDLSKMTNLKKLEIVNTFYTPSRELEMSFLGNIKEFKINQRFVVDWVEDTIIGVKNFTIDKLETEILTENQMDIIIKCPNLKSLKLHIELDSSLLQIIFENIKKLPFLEQLCISFKNISSFKAENGKINFFHGFKSIEVILNDSKLTRY